MNEFVVSGDVQWWEVNWDWDWEMIQTNNDPEILGKEVKKNEIRHSFRLDCHFAIS